MRKAKDALHILLVDDLPDGRETAHEFLQHLGYRKFTVVKDGSEAIDALEKDATIDLVLSDWDMPIVNGITLLRKIRANPRWEHLPFIMMTAPKPTEPEKLSLAIEGLVDDYIVKPFRLQTLEEKMNRVTSLSIHGRQRTVVVADDDTDSRDTVVEYLKRFGFKKIQTFNDGDSALGFLMQHPDEVGLIIADWEMPRMKGVELLSMCRTMEPLKDIPFFIITSQVSMERMKIMVAAQLHVDQYLLKPFTKDEFQARVERMLERARVTQEVKDLVNEGFQALERARTKAAQQCFEKALQLDPDYDLVLAGMGDLHWKNKNSEAAVPFFHKALTLNPSRESHYLTLASAYQELQQYGKAIHVLQMGQGTLKDNPRLALSLAAIYLDKKMPRKAFEELTTVLQKEPGNEEAAKLLALAKAELEEKGQKG